MSFLIFAVGIFCLLTTVFFVHCPLLTRPRLGTFTRQQKRSLAVTSYLLHWAMWLMIVGFVPLGLISEGLLVLFGFASITLAAIAIFWRLFGVVQFRLLELLLMLVLIGNLLAWSFSSNFRNPGFIRHESYVYFGFALVLSLVWGLGGATNGLLIAQRLQRNRTSERLWLMFVFIMLPAAIVALGISVILFVIGLVAPMVLFISVPVGLISLMIICEVHRLDALLENHKPSMGNADAR
jgi:hypothetical protein